MWSFTPPREFRTELLDLDEAPFEEVRQSLKDVQRVNRFLSGYRVLLSHLGSFLARHRDPAPFTILDAATGSADQPIAMVREARRRNVPVRVVALDINRKMLTFAGEMTARFPEIRFVQGDVLRPPFPDQSFDLVVNNLSLHHFEWDQAVALLQHFSRLARLGFIVNDLHRSRVAHAAIWLLTRLLTQNRLTRHDAPVSVFNAFTPGELRQMTQESALTEVEIHRHFPYRLALIQKKWIPETGPGAGEDPR